MIQLKVNGAEQSFDGDPEMPLLWYLRDILGLTGSKFGCGVGALRRLHGPREWTGHAILRGSMRDTAGKKSRRFEAREERIASGQKAWMQINVPQCGYCQVGQNHAGGGFIETAKKKPTDHEIDEAMSGTSAVAERISGFARRLKQRRGKWHERD